MTKTGKVILIKKMVPSIEAQSIPQLRTCLGRENLPR